MANEQYELPAGWKAWPPNGDDLVKEIQDKWDSTPGHGKHWAVQVTGTNPLSGYIVVMQPADRP